MSRIRFTKTDNKQVGARAIIERRSPLVYLKVSQVAAGWDNKEKVFLSNAFDAYYEKLWILMNYTFCWLTEQEPLTN